MINFSNDIILGFDRNRQPVILPKEQRSRHCLILGGTGACKSKALESIIRQDLLAWPHNRCGMAIFDPHSVVAENIASFCCAHGFDHLPVIPFDCRRLEWIISFNPLRARKGIEPATIVSACIDSLLLAWGQSVDEQNSTPRLEKWLRVILLTVFLSGGTLGDSLAIIRSPDIRRSMARAIEDDVAQAVWQSAASLKESEFVTLTESLANRVIRFVSATMMRLSINQTGASLDFGEAMRKGAIVLISLATSGGNIDEVDARTLGSLLLSDLWLAARVRGKKESGQQRSFRVILDEFSRFLTPTMADQMAEARGYGLEVTLCCQSLTQMSVTPTGKQILNAVLANCHAKVIFNIQHPDDIEILTPWLFRNEVDVDQVKHQHYATRTLDHRIEYLDSTSHSITRGTSESSNWSESESIGYSIGTSRGRSDSVGSSHGKERNRSTGRSQSRSVGSGESRATSSAESVQHGSTASRATGHRKSRSTSQSDARHIDGEYDDMRKIVGPEPTASFDRAFTDEDEDHRGLRRAIGNTKSQGESESDSESTGLASTNSTSRARAMQNTVSSSQSEATGLTESEGTGESDSVSRQRAQNASISESMSAGTAVSQTPVCTTDHPASLKTLPLPNPFDMRAAMPAECNEHGLHCG